MSFRDASVFFESDEQFDLQIRIDLLRDQLDLTGNPRSLEAHECELLIELLESWSMQESWENVIEWSSLALLSSCPLKFACRLYRFWMEALHRSHQLPELMSLCRHMLRFRREAKDLIGLTLMGLCYCGRRELARRVARSLQKRRKLSVMQMEGLAHYCTTFLTKKAARRALRTLNRTCEVGGYGYFSMLACVEQALANDCHDQAALSLNDLHRRYPFAPEPIRAAAQLAIDQSDWPEVVRLMRMLYEIDPTSTDSINGLVTALERAGELLGARALMQAKSHLFDVADYDFMATGGLVAYRLFKRYGMERDREEAIRFLNQGLNLCQAYGIGSASFSMLLHDLRPGSGELVVQGRREPHPIPKFWICLAEDRGWRHALPRRTFLVRTPPEAREGDFIFMCRGTRPESTEDWSILGVLEIVSPHFHDQYLESVVKVDHFKIFANSVPYPDTEPPILSHDGHGSINFSNIVTLYYAEVEREIAERIIAQVENLDFHGQFGKERVYA